MKQIIMTVAMCGVCMMAAVLYASSRSDYQVVEVYVCEEGQVLAEMLAKTSISRQELTVVSYCTCEGVDQGLKKEVKKMKCDPPKDMVYACTCVGRTGY